MGRKYKAGREISLPVGTINTYSENGAWFAKFREPDMREIKKTFMTKIGTDEDVAISAVIAEMAKDTKYRFMIVDVFIAGAQAPKWQPMDTAPKDGTEIMAGLTNVRHRRAVTIHWKKHYGWMNRFGDYDLNPYAWMPLPEPPERNEEEDQ